MKFIITLILSLSCYSSIAQIREIDSTCIGMVGIYADEGIPFIGYIYKDLNDKNSKVEIIISTGWVDEDSCINCTEVYYNGNLNYIPFSVQYYCYEVKGRWYRIYVEEPFKTLVWIKKKRGIIFYDCEELGDIKTESKRDYDLPCNE